MAWADMRRKNTSVSESTAMTVARQREGVSRDCTKSTPCGWPWTKAEALSKAVAADGRVISLRWVLEPSAPDSDSKAFV